MAKKFWLTMALVFLAGSIHAEESRSGFDLLKGKWVRPDGGYVLEIRDIAAEGKLDAGYFNPRSIHVEKATVAQESGTLKVFVELRDVNYPGSNYHLAYDPVKDILTGTYFQAVERQEYEVYFQRLQ